ncbi:MerR family DNA-binding transcriptional regulator [Actinosynnema pretiosum subsp. pretiosum]|uniref:MerR family DNA-binding transcriptional regulator n=1 Tax=Actinosynnema pretiosum subsp. pretiosum TaxID=103721 RepID=A0AA45L885_9PSEU|nr:Transcriptional regulator, MerR family [Actinosynnema pretiosum subsp. pretiosum]QUF05067.1 MerR family DNA-binding transcriptional regulator [Actinosynnema pretiosum subsp. pretiosum]
MTGISAHTVRFYEKEGLFASPVRRNASGRRVFDEGEVALLRAHERRMAGQVAELTSLLGVVRGKVALYEAHLGAGTADSLWRDSPDCSPPSVR